VWLDGNDLGVWHKCSGNQRGYVPHGAILGGGPCVGH
jgi:hypothetical protein